MEWQLAPSAGVRGRDVEVTKLVRVRHDNHDNDAFKRAVRPHEVPPAREPEQAGNSGQAPRPAAARTPAAGTPAAAARTPAAGRPIRVRHAPRHARTSDLRPRRRTSLSIRSAERRRWAADLSGPGTAGLVVYGMGGI